MDPLSPLLQALCRYLNENELFYVFTGELALRMLGMGNDVGTVELMVNLTAGEDQKFQNFLAHEGLLPRAGGGGARQVPAWRGGPGLRIRRAGGPADMAAIGRRVQAILEFQRFFIPATEDLLMGLLLDGGPKAQQAARLYAKWRDHLDLGYMVASARALGIYDRFMRVKKSADR